MDRSELIQEVVDRGYDFLSTARIGTFVDRSYQAICARFPWPFKEESVVVKAPHEFSDLDKILSVSDTAQEIELRGVDRRSLVSYTATLEESGEPECWFLENDTLKVFPESSNELSIRYLKVPAKLAEAEEPLVPEAWQYLIVDGAVVYCLRDDDEYSEARALQADIDQGIFEMMRALIPRNLQNDATVLRTGGGMDYL